ncbi:MAG: type II toxin-antitoxin system RelE/ParE family toxin, partial [bacterium]|nr:type II toxin-antitoxin system RelE/ParE family toxin [bacterium]
LDGSIKKVVLKQVKKLQKSPTLGEKLGNKAGLDLTGYWKIYVFKKKIRIVYRIQEGMLMVFIIAIGKREDMAVYQISSERKIKEKEEE